MLTIDSAAACASMLPESNPLRWPKGGIAFLSQELGVLRYRILMLQRRKVGAQSSEQKKKEGKSSRTISAYTKHMQWLGLESGYKMCTDNVILIGYPAGMPTLTIDTERMYTSCSNHVISQWKKKKGCEVVSCCADAGHQWTSRAAELGQFISPWERCHRPRPFVHSPVRTGSTTAQPLNSIAKSTTLEQL